jgi:hypothetical protein
MSFGNREQQRRQPRDRRDHGYAATDQMQHIIGKMRAAPELK